jgi:hypothetical protein
MRFMSLLMYIPHSNASYERVLSQVRKVKISFRSSMDDKKLRSILIVKGAFSGHCSQQTITPSTLRKAKLACQNA